MKISIYSKFAENLDLGRNFEKYSILVEIFEKSRFCSKFSKISIFAKFSKNLDFGRNFRKNFDFDRSFREIEILVDFF